MPRRPSLMLEYFGVSIVGLPHQLFKKTCNETLAHENANSQQIVQERTVQGRKQHIRERIKFVTETIRKNLPQHEG